ncbi:hypothetical protein [Flagellimonas okinawensis]|uniref:DUF4296 domain-containing protein n=1 Tax=Flagellimonas okinawensis TaxID=3031324 RepID=A0ABT5XPY0_9FLAO|nr:hypothetical protein [[Muricauda] okinawensis]MDF0707962.1 hypothetical protein [[Muricauda] okinawensis]
MKNLFLLLAIVLFSSCGHSDGNSVTGTAKIKDSALYYYTQSLNTNLSLTDKKQAANKSIYFAKKRKTDSLYLNILYQKELLSLSLGEYDSLVDYN